VITAVLAGATVGVVAIAASSHSLAAALISGVAVAVTVMTVLMRFQVRAYRRAATGGLLADLDGGEAQPFRDVDHDDSREHRVFGS
jgi:hypothetical protein